MYKSLNIIDKEVTAKKLHKIRTQRKLTMKQLADLCGLSAQSICAIENAQKEPRMCNLQKIADALGVTIEKLM